MKSGILDDLKASRELKSREMVLQFQNAVSRISAMSLRHEDIAPFFLILNDSAPNQEIMWELLHAIEDADDLVFVDGYIASIPDFVRSAPDWMETVQCRVLNNPQTRQVFVDRMSTAPAAVKHAALPLLQQIANEQDKTAAAAKGVLAALSL